MRKYFVTGIDTDCGKTLVSAILTEKLKADYWKPIQAGSPTDSDAIRSLAPSVNKIHPEGIALQAPMSPHAAAKLERIELKASQFTLPLTDNTLIIEGAGGIMVPINDHEFVINLAHSFDAPIILVSRNYLGSINHTLLTIAYLKANHYKIEGIIFNDTTNEETEKFILEHSKLTCLGRIGKLESVESTSVQSQVNNLTLK